MSDTDNSNNYYPYFDILRIVLASIVMLGHDKIIAWPQSGNLAVQVFFALSGWLIGGILLNLAPKGLPRFYFNRAFRIWVPYYVALILLVCASLMKDPLNPKWFEFIFYKASFVYNIFGPPQLASFKDMMPLNGTGNHFWSVNAEEQFYLLAPLLLVMAGWRFGRNLWLWLVISILALILNTYASIVLGVLAAVVAKSHGDIHCRQPARAIFLAILLLAGGGIYYGYNYNILAPLLSISIVMLLAVKGNINQLGKFLGGMSYPLYLNHWIGVFVGNAMLAPFGLRDSLGRQLISVVVSYIIAAFLYWYVDKRVLDARSSLYSASRGVFITYAAYSMVVIGLLGGAFIHALT